MNNVEIYLTKLAQFVIDNPLQQEGEEGFDYSIPMPQIEEMSQIPSFINMNEGLVRQQTPTFGFAQSSLDSEPEGSESDLYAGSSEPDNGMGMM